MIHIDVKKKIEELRLKVGIRFNLLDLEKYINNIDDDNLKTEKLVELIEKYRLTIDQNIIDIFKDEEWFKAIFFENVSDELLIDEKNKDLLNAILYENKTIPHRYECSRDLIIKLIKTNCSPRDIKLSVDEVEKNDYELLKLMKKYNSYLEVKANKAILEKCIELKINPYLISDEYYISELLSSDDKGIDLVKQFIDDGMNIRIPNSIYENNLIELYNSYPQKVIEDIKTREEIVNIFGKYINNNKIEKIDDNILYYVVYSLDANKILDNIDKIKDIDLRKEFTFFSEYSDEKKEYLRKIIKSGFPDIIKCISNEYIDEEIMDLALSNGFSNYSFIYEHFPNKLNEPQVFEFLDKLIMNYVENYDVPSYLINKIKNNRDVFYNILTQSQIENIPHSSNIKYFSLENILDYFFEKLRNDNNKNYYVNFFSNIYFFNLNSDIKNRIVEEYKKLYDDDKIDLNLFERDFLWNNYGRYTFKSDEDIKRAFDNGFKEIFLYLERNDIEKWIKYAIEIHYTTDSKINYRVKDFLKNNMNYLQEIIKMDPEYINILQSQIDIEKNIELVHECINMGIQPNDQIKRYLIFNESEKVYTYKIQPRISYLLDNVKSENNNILKYINEKEIYDIEENNYYFEPKEESIFINTFNDNIGNPDYKDIIVSYIKKNNNIPRNMIDKVSSNNEIMDELIDYNLGYIRYAQDDYIENNKDQLMKKIINTNSVAMYLDYNFVKDYLKNTKDINEIIRIKRDSNISYAYFNEEIVNNNSYLKNEKDLVDYISNNHDEIMDNPNLILSNPIIFKKYLEQPKYINIKKLFMNVLIINDNISDILKDYPVYLKSMDVSKFSNNFIENNYQLFIDNNVKLNTETKAYLFNNCKSYRDKYNSDDEISEISNYVIYDKVKNDDYILLKLIRQNTINILKPLSKDLETVKRLVENGALIAIDVLDPNILLSDMDLCKLIIDKRYKISANTSLKLLCNIEFDKMLILKNLNSLDMLPDEILNDETNGIVELAFNNGYKISNKTPRIISSNLAYINNFVLKDDSLELKDKLNFIDDKLLLDESNGLFDSIFEFTYINEYAFSEIKYINNIEFIKLIINKILTLGIKYANLVDILQCVNIDIIDDDLFDVIANNESLLKKLCLNSSIYSSRFINDTRVIETILIIHNYLFDNKLMDCLVEHDCNENSIKYIVNNYAKFNSRIDITKLINKINDVEIKQKIKLIEKIESNSLNLTEDEKKLLFEDNMLYSLLIKQGTSIQFTDDRYTEKINEVNTLIKFEKHSVNFSNEEIDIILKNENARDRLIFWTLFGNHQHFKDVASEETWNYVKHKIPSVIQFYEENNVDGFTTDNFKEVYNFSPSRYFIYLEKNKIIDKRYFTVFNNNIDGIIDGIEKDRYNRYSHIYSYVINYLSENDLNLLKDTIETKGCNFSKYLFDEDYEISINSPKELKDKDTLMYAIENYKIDNSNGLLVYGLSDEECKSIYDRNLFSGSFDRIFCNDEYKKYYDNRVLQYIEFSQSELGRCKRIIKSFNDLYNYFEDDGPNKKLYEEIICSSVAFEELLNDEKYINDYINRIKPSNKILEYIEFTKENGFVLEKYIKEPNDIENYFEEEGPKEILYKKALFDSELFDAVFKNDKYYNDYITRFNPTDAIKNYIKFTKENGFILEKLVKREDDIENYFDTNGFSDLGIYTILKDVYIYENLDNIYFENFYQKHFGFSSILNYILIKFDNNYSYLMDFLINTLNLSLPIKEIDEVEIKNMYCLDMINIGELIEIIKYVYFGPIDKTILKNIIINNELSLCINFYLKICSKWEINDFIKFISNYEENKELCNNLINEEELANDEKLKLQMILINGFRGAFGVIKTKNDLANFNTLIVENNNNIIKSNNTNDIKKLIFNYLFNISIDEVQIIKGKYEKNFDGIGKDESNKGLKKLQSNLNNSELKEIIDEYDTIIKFILDIEKSNDLDGLNQMANILNGLVHNGQLSKLYELWDLYSKLDSDIMTICGEEINEKIINYDELLNTTECNIPLIDNEKSFFVKNASVPVEFEYDGEIIDGGTNVKMIELNGLPFVAFGHVLNAFGSGGKLSDYNHPRVIGRTHLCLSAIDDNYYSLVERDDKGIDYVQLLFNDLPAEQLVISSHRDVGSHTNNNSKIVFSGYKGAYLPIRETISETYHGGNGYNEYVYYREGLKPSGILIRGNEPSESEIQAAAYLSRICGKDIPLIKINKEKYPIRTKEEMQKRDEELKDYYKGLYEARKRNQRLLEIEKMKQLREYLIKLKLLGDSGEQFGGEQNERRK